MKFNYCPVCGTKAILKEIGDEGEMPYCETCNTPLFPMFSTCVIVLVVNEYQEVALLKQAYISTQYCNLVSGYMVPEESGESSACREVKEELGITLTSLQLIKTHWFKKKGLLMLEYIGHCKKQDFQLSKEVDEAHWVSIDKAFAMVHPKGSASYDLLEQYIAKVSK